MPEHKPLSSPSQTPPADQTQPPDEKQVETFARLGADDQDIAALLDVPVKRLRRRWSATLAKARAQRRTNLRGLIWATAAKGNATLLAWLGKIELGWEQRQHQQTEKRRKPRFDFTAFAKAFAEFHDGKSFAPGQTAESPRPNADGQRDQAAETDDSG